MSCEVIAVAKNFYNIRGSFKIGHFVDIGTQSSLVQLDSGKFVILDACNLNNEIACEVDQLTNNGKAIEAIINLHPFHTLHVKAMQERYPWAKLYGTARHLKVLPDLPWQAALTESAAMQALYSNDFDFFIPRGVDFISTNDKLHFASVLAYHRSSKTLHVDDTLINIQLPSPLGLLAPRHHLSFHPTLAKTLEPRAGAANDFRTWAEHLAAALHESENLCAAHTKPLLAKNNRGATIEQRILRALNKVSKTLYAHEKKYG